jgi:hypothetical protein
LKQLVPDRDDDRREAEPERLASNTNEIAEGDEVEAHAACYNTNETSVEDGLEDET